MPMYLKRELAFV
uniref:Uncharacterized protein n=1 Tax=Anguilla anguilla TaxID=7936 RepID=A0A0E9UMJ0_ANGAN